MKVYKEKGGLAYQQDFLGNLKTKLDPQAKIIFILVSVVFIWFFDSVIHLVVGPEHSFYEALFNSSTHEICGRMALSLAISGLLILFFKYTEAKSQSFQIKDVLNGVLPICITNLNYEIVKANESYWSDWAKKGDGPIKCYENRPGRYCHTEKCALSQILNGAEEYVCESQKNNNGEIQYFIVTARPLRDSNNKTIGVIESFQDITVRKKLEEEKKHLISEIQKSLQKVKLLSGIIPICASCKKIRDDKGFWKQVELYVRDHSEAEFSHCLCPHCVQELYPDLDLPGNKLESVQ